MWGKKKKKKEEVKKTIEETVTENKEILRNRTKQYRYKVGDTQPERHHQKPNPYSVKNPWKWEVSSTVPYYDLDEIDEYNLRKLQEWYGITSDLVPTEEEAIRAAKGAIRAAVAGEPLSKSWYHAVWVEYDGKE